MKFGLILAVLICGSAASAGEACIDDSQCSIAGEVCIGGNCQRPHFSLEELAAQAVKSKTIPPESSPIHEPRI